MNSLLGWLDQRTGYKAIMKHALYENVPGGARWRYVWGSTLTFCLAIQFITGIFLWMAYSPSSQTAWESVYYIQNEMLGGWFLRGLHHYTAQAMNVLLVLHLMQVVIDAEATFSTGVSRTVTVELLLMRSSRMWAACTRPSDWQNPNYALYANSFRPGNAPHPGRT